MALGVDGVTRGEPGADAARIRTLLVDDSASWTRAMSSYLSTFADFGPVVSVGTAEAALTVIDEFKPTVVVSDIIFGTGPDGEQALDGLELCRRIKKQWPHIGLIVASGQPDVQLIRCLMNAGIDDYISKGFAATDGIVTSIRSAHMRGANRSRR